METVEQAAREYTKQYSVEPQSYTTVAADAFIAGAQWQSSNQDVGQAEQVLKQLIEFGWQRVDGNPLNIIREAERLLKQVQDKTTPPSPNQSEEK